MSLRKIDPSLAPQIHRGGLSSREGLAYLIHDGYMDGKKEVEPIHDKRLWVIESEFANVLHQTKRDGNTLSSALRDCWDGVGIKPATKSNRISANDPHVSISAAVTPSELLSLIEARELSNGFTNRFLTIFSERSRLLPFPQATPQAQVDERAAQLAQVLRTAGADRWVDRDARRMSLAPSAAKEYEKLYRSELNRHDYGPLVTGLLERRAPILLRPAMIFALTEETTVIGPLHIQAALAWVRFWVESVRFIFSSGADEVIQHEVASAATKIAAFLQQGRQSRKAINVSCLHGKLSKDRLDAALDELLQATPPVIEVEVEPRKDAPGSPTKFYRLAANSANSANCQQLRVFAGDSLPGEVSELSHDNCTPGCDLSSLSSPAAGPCGDAHQFSRFAEFAEFAGKHRRGARLMGAVDLVFRLAAEGFRLRAQGGELLVAPASKATGAMLAELRESKPELLALLKVRTCGACRHLSNYGTCKQPVAAGLRTQFEGFGIAWPQDGYGAACRAWKRNPATAIASVLTTASRQCWPDSLLDQWLKDADEFPDETLELMRAGGPTR